MFVLLFNQCGSLMQLAVGDDGTWRCNCDLML